MKRLSTSLLIFILALLALPERAWAEDVYLLTAQTIKGTPGNYNVPSNHKFESAGGTVYTYTFSNTEAIGDIYFRIGVNDWTVNKQMRPTNDGDQLTINGEPYSITDNNYGSSDAWKLALDNNKYSSYTITVDIGSTKYVKVTGVESGTATTTTYNLVYLFDNELNGKQLHTWLEGGATDKGITDWNSRPTIGSGDFATTTKYNGTQYYTKTFSVDKNTADSFKQIGVKIGDKNGPEFTSSKISSTWDNVQYIIVTLSNVTIVENTATMYKVKISAGEGGSVSLTGDQQIGSTPVEVTATPKSGYEFVNWTPSDGVTVANASSPTTTVTATKDGTLTANFKATSTPTPITGNNFYLVGNLFDNETNINYDTRYFKFTDNGNNSYSLDIPATLTVKAQILSVNGSTEKVYGPSTGQNGLSVSGETLSDNGQITDELSEGDKTPAYFWNFQDRTLAHDGIYTITITLNSEGVPGSWTIKHDKTRRVAYYLSNSDGSTAQAAYAEKKDNGNGGCDNKFFGSVFLSKGTGCYVISNITKEADSNYNSLLKTTTKFYLQGNSTGGSPVTGKSAETKVFPVKYNGSETSYKPFVFNNDQDLQLLLEYNPSTGEDETAKKYSYIGGEVKLADYQDASGVKLPQITGMKIVGPAVNNSWNLEDAVLMTYNDADNCWEAIINTSAKAGEKFRFVANNTWENSWQENGTKPTDKAKIPYNKPGDGHAATTADPNEVSYINTLESADDISPEYDIIFNRDHGTWRVRFYIETQSASGGNSYKYVFKYTINGYESVVRTYCSNQDEIPTDKSIKIYGAYAFEGNETDKSGTIKLYEMNYIPANEGVILYSTNAIEGWNFEHYTRPEGETKYKNIPDNNYINYLKGTLVNTPVNASEFNKENVRTHRNFFFNYLKNSGYYKEGDTDYLGFFRIKTGKSTCKANHAYLSLPTNVLAWNGQTFEQVMESGDQQASLTKGMRIVFSDGSDWVEDVPTSITTIKDKNRVFDNYYYTLQGVRVEKPLKGIYIHNGKKVVIK